MILKYSPSKVTEYRDRLQKRCDHLDKRIATAEADGQDLSFDKAERSALVFAIDLIDQTLVETHLYTLESPSWRRAHIGRPVRAKAKGEQ